MTQLCDYGCGQEANYQLKNGKWCCSKSNNSCPHIRSKNSISKKGQLPWITGGKHSEETKKKMSESHKGKTISKETRKKFSYYRKGRKHSEETKNKMSESHKGHPYHNVPQSKEQRKKHSEFMKSNKNPMLGKKHSKESKRKMSESSSGKNHPLYGKHHSKETKKKISSSNKGKTSWNKNIKINCKYVNYYQKKYPFFAKIEELRDNPVNGKRIQVHCKNHNCVNSKEKGGWFIPTGIQLSCRIVQLENNNGNEGSYFYCSDKCKGECPLYNVNTYNKPNYELPYTLTEYNIFRNWVLKRDDYKCQYCGEKANIVHHERPQKLEPFFSLDPDYGWSVCSNCHYKYGHKDECSTGQLAAIICTN